MLGTRTKQVNSYGRRSCRIVNVSTQRDRGSAKSSEAASDADTPPPRHPRRENAIIISPSRSRVGTSRLGGSGRSPRSSPLTQNRHVRPKRQDATTKRMQTKPESSTHFRQPLTPLRPNGTLPDEQVSSKVKNKPKAFITKSRFTSLKPHTPVITVDIIVLDDEGNMLAQEQRLSHTEMQADQTRTAAGKGKEISKASLTSPPPVTISDDSDPEMVSPKLIVKRLNRRPLPVVISSDESEADDEHTVYKKRLPPLAKSQPRSKSLRVEGVVPSAAPRRSKIPKIRPNSISPVLTPPKIPALSYPAVRRGPVTVPSLLVPPIPIAKPRQLTPIRGNLFRRLPPTPSTPTEADLSLDLAQLHLNDITDVDDFIPAQPEYLLPLLNECAQTCPYEFSAFIETFPFDPIVQSSAEDQDPKFRKIGEASYSEVFGIGDVVLKIIPIQLEDESTQLEVAEIPAPSAAKDVLKEITATREIGEICDKFVKLLKTYVVRGRYPSLLLNLWDEYNEKKGSESVRPESFGLTQIYVIIILPNGGPDLESFAFKNVSKTGWHQACGIFWQVARALEQAEYLANFEHRDLHWGQILVKSIPAKKSTNKRPTSRVAMDDLRFGVKVTIIDLGLARMDAIDARGSSVYWTPFDNEIFEGEGDYQYDIYRMMRDSIGGAWKSYHPFTNIMWLHYLVTKLLHEKRLRLPSSKRQAGGETQVVSSTGYDERQCYDCLAEMERLLGDCIVSGQKGQKTCRKTMAPSNRLKSARDVITYGLQRGWVQ